MSKKQHISTEMKANIADALAGGLSYAMIADRYDVSYSTIQRVKSAVINGANFIAKKEVPEVHDTPTEQKKSPEAPTPMENASEDITPSGNPAGTNIIPEVPENVKAETPLETISHAFSIFAEQISHSLGGSAQENSTPLHERYSSLDIVDEAVLEKIQRNKDEIAEHRERIDYLEFEIERLNEFHCNFTEGRSV